MKVSTIISLAGINGFAATGIAAIGSHALPIAANDMGLFETATLFHFVHTLAIIGCALVVKWSPGKPDAPCWGSRAANFFIVGIMCFSFSLYWRAVVGPGSLGSYHWITPLGGLALMGGWLTFAWAGWKSRELG